MSRALFSLPDVVRFLPAWLQAYLADRDAEKAAQTVASAAKEVQASETPRHLALVGEVDRAVEEEIARREAAARGALIAAVATPGAETLPPETLAAVVHRAVEQATVDLSPARTLDTARRVTNAGFGAGRGDAAERIATAAGAERFRGQIYTAVMDGGTCSECAKYDGAEFPLGWGTQPGQINAPNTRCEGTLTRCRCTWALIFKTESDLPPSTSPRPVQAAEVVG